MFCFYQLSGFRHTLFCFAWVFLPSSLLMESYSWCLCISVFIDSYTLLGAGDKAVTKRSTTTTKHFYHWGEWDRQMDKCRDKQIMSGYFTGLRDNRSRGQGEERRGCYMMQCIQEWFSLIWYWHLTRDLNEVIDYVIGHIGWENSTQRKMWAAKS